MTSTKTAHADKLHARAYVRDILNGLVPSDPTYDAIYDAVAAHGGVEFDRREASINIVAMADAIRSIRAEARNG